MCFYQTLTWLLQRWLSQHLWERWRRTARSCCSNPPSMTLRTAACVISFYWMTLNKGSRSSCDGCTRSFNRLTWTNNYALQFRENNQKKEKEKESKCLRTHPILNLFKLLQSFLKLQYQGFIPLWSQASGADGRGQEMWPAGFNNKPYSSTEVIEKFWKYLRYIFYVYLLREESQYRTCLIKKNNHFRIKTA